MLPFLKDNIWVALAKVQYGWVQAVDPLKISTPQATGDISNEENSAPATADWQ